MPDPEAMRSAVSAYVEEIHRTYLHVLATAEPLGPVRGQEVATQPEPDPDKVRKALLDSVGGRAQWSPEQPA